MLTGQRKFNYWVFLSGEYRDVDDTDPSAIGRWKVKDDVLKDLQANPFRIAPNASAGFLSNSDFLTEDDFENVQAIKFK